MKTQLSANSSEPKKLEDHNTSGLQDNLAGNAVKLSTFSLTELVYEAIRNVPGSYLQMKIMEAELVVIRSDRSLVIKAVEHCLQHLLQFSLEQGGPAMMGLRIHGSHGVGFIEVECHDLDLTSLSLRTGRNALVLSGHAEPDFGFVLADMALKKVKGSFNIYHNRTGGAKLLLEIPKVRGEAS